MSELRVDISNKPSPHGFRNRAARALWGLVYPLLFRPSPKLLHGWRRFLLRCFGADISPKARVHPRAKIWGPWNLTMGDHATMADYVDCYCVDRIRIGNHTTVSQYTYLCGATHDFEHRNFLLRPGPISIGSQCWLAADVFVGPNVTIGEGAVVGARSSVFRDLPPWTVCVGTPARPVRPRVISRPDGRPDPDVPHVQARDAEVGARHAARGEAGQS